MGESCVWSQLTVKRDCQFSRIRPTRATLVTLQEWAARSWNVALIVCISCSWRSFGKFPLYFASSCHCIEICGFIRYNARLTTAYFVLVGACCVSQYHRHGGGWSSRCVLWSFWLSVFWTPWVSLSALCQMSNHQLSTATGLPSAMVYLGWTAGVIIMTLSWIATLYTLYQMCALHEVKGR